MVIRLRPCMIMSSPPPGVEVSTDCSWDAHIVTVDHASLSRRNTAPTPNGDTSNIWALITFFSIYYTFRYLVHFLPVSSFAGTIYKPRIAIVFSLLPTVVQYISLLSTVVQYFLPYSAISYGWQPLCWHAPNFLYCHFNFLTSRFLLSGHISSSVLNTTVVYSSALWICCSVLRVFPISP